MRLPTLPSLQPRERLLAVGSGVILLVVILDRLVLSPWWRHIEAVREEIQQTEQTLQRRTKLLARKDQVLGEMERYRRFIRPSIADDLQMAALIKELEDLASHSEVALAEIKPLTVQTDHAINRYSLDVSFGCTLEQWAAFLFQIETSPSLYEVEQARLSALEENAEQLEGQLRVVATSAQLRRGNGADDAAAIP